MCSSGKIIEKKRGIPHNDFDEFVGLLSGNNSNMDIRVLQTLMTPGFAYNSCEIRSSFGLLMSDKYERRPDQDDSS